MNSSLLSLLVPNLLSCSDLSHVYEDGDISGSGQDKEQRCSPTRSPFK